MAASWGGGEETRDGLVGEAFIEVQGYVAVAGAEGDAGSGRADGGFEHVVEQLAAAVGAKLPAAEPATKA